MMYLIDNQLPVGLERHLQRHGLDALHVSSCKLERASDNEIWEYAKANNCVIVTKDDDFLHLSGKDIQGPPVIWVRLGNCRNPQVFEAFDRILPLILEAIESGTKVIELQ